MHKVTRATKERMRRKLSQISAVSSTVESAPKVLSAEDAAELGFLLARLRCSLEYVKADAIVLHQAGQCSDRMLLDRLHTLKTMTQNLYQSSMNVFFPLIGEVQRLKTDSDAE